MSRRNLLGIVLLGWASPLAAQWQLPPGTSASTDTVKPAADTSAATVQRAEALLEQQRWRAAVDLLRPVVGREPKNAHAQYDLAFALDNANDAEGAKVAYQAAAAADPSLVSARVSLGLLLARQGDAKAAAKWLREAVALNGDAATQPARAQADRALARIDLSEKPEGARDELLAAIQLSQEQPDDLVLSAEIAEALHDDDAAAAAYARALAFPQDAEVSVAYARVLARQGKQEQAAAVLAKAGQHGPPNRVVVRQQASLLLQEKKFTEAIPLLESLHAADPADNGNTRTLAHAYVAIGALDKAEPLLRRLAQEQPESGDAAADLGDVLVRAKQNAEAEQVLTGSLQKSFSSTAAAANAAGRLAFAASVNKDPAAVIHAVEMRNRIATPDAPTTFLLATAHDTLHHTAQAAEKYREFIQLAGQAYPDEVWQSQQRLQVLRRAK